MKNCRTLSGLMKAIENRENCQLKYESKGRTRDGYILYLVSGQNLIITEDTYREIEDYLVQA